MISMTRHAALLALLSLSTPVSMVSAAGRTAAAIGAPHDEASLIAAEDARFAALIRHDGAAVASGLAEDLVYSHGNGKRQGRDDYLAALNGGGLDYRRIAASDRIVHVYGTVGTTRAVLATMVGDRPMRSSVLGVYIWRDGRWQLAAWQTTPLPDL
jgi:hypothetical protein